MSRSHHRVTVTRPPAGPGPGAGRVSDSDLARSGDRTPRRSRRPRRQTRFQGGKKHTGRGGWPGRAVTPGALKPLGNRKSDVTVAARAQDSGTRDLPGDRDPPRMIAATKPPRPDHRIR
eukprot:764705-Hanusia_phi.AAC.3